MLVVALQHREQAKQNKNKLWHIRHTFPSGNREGENGVIV